MSVSRHKTGFKVFGLIYLILDTYFSCEKKTVYNLVEALIQLFDPEVLSVQWILALGMSGNLILVFLTH